MRSLGSGHDSILFCLINLIPVGFTVTPHLVHAVDPYYFHFQEAPGVNSTSLGEWIDHI